MTSSSTPRGVVASVRPEPVRDAEHVRVDGERRFLERDRHHDVGGFAADAGQRFERLRSPGTAPPCSATSRCAAATMFFAFIPEEAARFDDRLDVRGIGARERTRVGIPANRAAS